MRVCRPAVFVAILILATPGAYLFEYDVSQTYGWPTKNDQYKRIFIVRYGEYSKVKTYNATIKMPTKITCIKFEDLRKNAATVWISHEPPCSETKVVITSLIHRGFAFWMIVYYERK